MIERCMQCGRCSAACPAAVRMDLTPHRWVGLARAGDLAAVRDAAAIWLCVGCFCCAARCPRGVRPVELAEAARVMVVRTKAYETSMPDDVPARIQENMPQQLLVAALRKKR